MFSNSGREAMNAANAAPLKAPALSVTSLIRRIYPSGRVAQLLGEGHAASQAFGLGNGGLDRGDGVGAGAGGTDVPAVTRTWSSSRSSRPAARCRQWWSRTH